MARKSAVATKRQGSAAGNPLGKKRVRWITAEAASAWAKRKGLLVSKTVLNREARRGREVDPNKRGKIIVPHARRVKDGFVFDHSKMLKVLAKVPIRVVPPAGSVTGVGLERIAKERGLKLSRGNITIKLKRMLKGKEPPAKGLATDPYDKQHTRFIPKALAEEMLAEAELRKIAPELVKQEIIVPLISIGKDLNVGQTTIFKIWKWPRIKIGTNNYALVKHADAFKAEYMRQKNAGAVRSRVRIVAGPMPKWFKEIYNWQEALKNGERLSPPDMNFKLQARVKEKRPTKPAFAVPTTAELQRIVKMPNDKKLKRYLELRRMQQEQVEKSRGRIVPGVEALFYALERIKSSFPPGTRRIIETVENRVLHEEFGK